MKDTLNDIEAEIMSNAINNTETNDIETEIESSSGKKHVNEIEAEIESNSDILPEGQYLIETDLGEVLLVIKENTVELIPTEPIPDNSIIEITLSGLKALDKEVYLPETVLKFYTKLTPSYCSLESVMSLIESVDVSEDKILYYIKEASMYADYISGQSFGDNPPFHVTQFVKFRAAHDALLKLFIDRASEAGYSGRMGEVQFQVSDNADAIKDLLDYLSKEAKKWEEEVMDKDRKRGAAPKSAIRSNPARYGTSLSGFNRGPFG